MAGANATQGELLTREMGRNWTANMTYGDTPLSLTNQKTDYENTPDMLHEFPWYQTFPATLSIIILLLSVFVHQWNRRRTKRQCLVTYNQLIRKKQYYKGILSILSHPPAMDNVAMMRRSLAIGLGSFVEGDRWIQEGRTCLYHVTHGHLSGLPLLLYNSHLLWSCRALEPLFPSSWQYLRSLVALAIMAMAIELIVAHSIVHRTYNLIGSDTTNLGSYQPNFGADPLIRVRDFIRHRTMGTCSALLHAVLFLYGKTFPHVAVPVLPLVSIPINPWMSYLSCSLILGALSWRHHAVSSFLAGTLAGGLWTLGFHFLGELYWGTCLLMWVGMASVLSLKTLWPFIPGIYAAWDAQGIIWVQGVAVISSFRDESEQQRQLHGVNHDDDEFDDDPYDDDIMFADLENQQLRGRLPLVDFDQDEEQPTAPHSHGLIRRGGGALN